MYRRDSIQVLNLFQNKLADQDRPIEIPEIPEMYASPHKNDEALKKKEEEELMKQLERFDENVKHAILLRREKDGKSEFYRKLENLNDKILTYQDLFEAKKPSFITMNSKYKGYGHSESEAKKVSVNMRFYILHSRRQIPTFHSSKTGQLTQPVTCMSHREEAKISKRHNFTV